MRRPGYTVKCKDGAIGRTYNDEERVQGKIIVHVFAPSLAAFLDPKKTIGDCIKKRLCDPNTLTTIGMAD